MTISSDQCKTKRHVWSDWFPRQVIRRVELSKAAVLVVQSEEMYGYPISGDRPACCRTARVAAHVHGPVATPRALARLTRALGETTELGNR